MVLRAQRIKFFADKTLRGLAFMGFVSVLLMMLVGTVDVILQGFGSSLPATVPWTEVLNVIAVMLPLAFATSERAHIAIDLVTGRLPRKGKRVADRIVMVVTFLFMAIMSWQLSIQAWRSLRTWEFDQLSVKIYYWPAKIALAIAFIMSAAIVLFQMVDEFRGLDRQK